ncbi:MAG: phosphatase PAP2 family protein, partial [Elusimicrobia bacterium]|nr:phosphatase PAP2 family protein [Elusimicrobiota bacterium]
LRIAFALALSLSFGFYCLDWFNAARFAAGRPFTDIGMRWETAIALRPGWVWVYFLYFPVCFLPLFLPEVRRDIAVFRRTALGYAVQFVVAGFFFFMIPLRMTRPELASSTLSLKALQWVYAIDPGFNIFPSLHVANTAFLACMAWKFRGRAAGLCLWIICILISISAMLVKQHYFWDIPSGLLLGAAGYRLAFASALGDLLAQADLKKNISQSHPQSFKAGKIGQAGLRLE